MKKKKPTIFIQDFGIFQDDVLVSAGGTQAEIVAFAKKHKASKEFIDWVSKDKEIFEIAKGKEAICVTCPKVGRLLLLGSVLDRWEYWEGLMHEVHHVVFEIAKEKLLTEETECQAYLFQYLFRNIRHKLQCL